MTVRLTKNEATFIKKAIADETKPLLERIEKLEAQPQTPMEWPSREVVAREIRRAMLDNPTDDSFNKRAEERERIANYTADVILERFAAAVSRPQRETP